MPPVGVASVPEMDAAEALLELQDSRETERVSPNQPNQVQEDFTTEIESTATESMSLQRYGTENGPATSTPKNKGPGSSSPTIIKLPTGGYIIRNNPTSSPVQYRNTDPINKKRTSLHKKYQEEQKRWSKDKAAKIANGTNKTRTVATQTEIEYQLPQIAKMESFVQELCDKIKKLENQLENCGKSPNIDGTKISSSGESNECFSGDGHNSSRKKYHRRVKTNSGSISQQRGSKDAIDDGDDDSDFKIDEEERDEEMDESENGSLSDEQGCTNSMIRKCNITNFTTEMVPIGDGNAIVPSRILRQLDWTSYTNATRKLLTAVFSRRVLATHSLTGKPSPAFPDKPAKKRLDPALVNDIVQTVVDRCKVPENVVRTSITTKCADESKMFRSRQQNKKKNRVLKKENIPPRTSGSDSSTHS